MNTVLTAPAKEGRRRTITVKNAKQYHVGTLILVGADNVKGHEVARIKDIKGDQVTFFKPRSTTIRRTISCRRSSCAIGGGWTWIWGRCSGMTMRSARRPGRMAGSA